MNLLGFIKLDVPYEIHFYRIKILFFSCIFIIFWTFEFIGIFIPSCQGCWKYLYPFLTLHIDVFTCLWSPFCSELETFI